LAPCRSRKQNFKSVASCSSSNYKPTSKMVSLERLSNCWNQRIQLLAWRATRKLHDEMHQKKSQVNFGVVEEVEVPPTDSLNLLC
jgi:hypothetical protein